ncbi:MAG: response regulator [Acidobacteria bacterium]|nr:response regulator [Acidobacteriota bacterium]
MSLEISLKRNVTPNTSHTIGMAASDYRNIFADLPAAAWIVDSRTGKLLEANRAAAELFGYARPGTETVLLVEDDEAVRRLVRDTLERSGYRVRDAPTAEAALAISSGRPSAIDLMITDVVLPGMNGRELAGNLLAARPGLRVLYMSGYTEDAVLRAGILEERMSYLPKPFTPRALETKVRELMHNGRGGCSGGGAGD